MRFLDAELIGKMFDKAGFYVDDSSTEYRRELCLDDRIAKNQSRVGFMQPPETVNPTVFALNLIGWFQYNSSRLLWIDHWNLDFPSLGQLLILARRGLGENRSLSDAPGHYFENLPFDKQDRTDLSDSEAVEISILTGLIVLIIASTWDGWLISGNEVDRIEFWEGNIFFYSKNKNHIIEAEKMMNSFSCKKIY